MSDEVISMLKDQVRQLEHDKAQLITDLRKERGRRQALQKEATEREASHKADLEKMTTDLTEAVKDRDSWQEKAKTAPDEHAARIAELETQLKVHGFRDAFSGLIGKELAQGVTVEDLWHFGQFDPSKVENLTEAQITDMVGRLREEKPILFAIPSPQGNGAPAGGPSSAVQKPAPLRKSESPSRGARDQSSSQLRYSKRDLQKPGWERKNPELAKAISEGRAVFVEE